MSELSTNIPAEAIQVLQTFLDAALRHDTAAMAACVGRKTLESGRLDSAGPDGVTFVMGQGRMEGEQVVIPVKGSLPDAPPGTPALMEMDCLMVKEAGQWKLDLDATIDRMMGGNMGAVVEQLTTAMAGAMEGIGKAMAEGLSQAFGEASPEPGAPEPSWDDAPLTFSADELLPLPTMTTLPKTGAAMTRAVGSRVVVQAAIADLARGGDADERKALVDWFEDQLLAGWGDLFAPAEREMPGLLKNRLRAVRLEAATLPHYRFLALDGRDLVYRMSLPNSDGYFSNDEVTAMLPGVLAGLPETIDAAVTGFRLLPTDDESPSVDVYRNRVGPRYMRRISDLVGHHVRLDVDWEAAGSGNVCRQLAVWGLNRVYGGIALVCLDPSRRQALSNGLKRVRLTVGCEVSETLARYEGGTLELSLNFFEGDKPGCYEHEIAMALAGNETA